MTHHVFKTTLSDRHELVRTLASGKGRRILFTRTKFQTQKLAKDLTQNGIPAAELHGNLSQNQRDRNLAAFNSGDVNVMVATDVAARGIDVSGVELVVQVEPPEDPKSFLHRSGRTARAGHSGDVVTIILPNQRRRTRRMMREAGLEVEPIDVTPDSPEVLELVGEVAEPVFGWTLEQSQPAGNPRRRKNGNGGADGERSGKPNRSGGRNKDRGKDKGGKPFKSERKDRRNRDQREERNDNAKKFEPKQNRAERRAAKFEGRDNREFEAREHRWEHPEIQEERRDQREEKRNNKRREKYARLHEQQRSDNEQHETANKRRHDGDYGNTNNRRGPGKKKSAQLAKKQGVPSKKQRKSEARAERRYDDDRRSKGKKHDERSSDAKRYDRHTEVKRGGRGERHDKHAGQSRHRHANIRKAPFRTR